MMQVVTTPTQDAINALDAAIGRAQEEVRRLTQAKSVLLGMSQMSAPLPQVDPALAQLSSFASMQR